jgi:PAS domain-containing protein
MSRPACARYQVNARWEIVGTNEGFCRLFRSTEAALLGRDIRDLLRQDWQRDFRNYVARALVGVGGIEATVPMRAPGGYELWCKHELEPIMQDGRLAGYHASVEPRHVAVVDSPKRWWQWRSLAPRLVWDTAIDQPTWDHEMEQLARAS